LGLQGVYLPRDELDHFFELVKSKGLKGLTLMLFPISNGHDRPWLFSNGSHPFVFQTKANLPF
jgi:hypothetical protein